MSTINALCYLLSGTAELTKTKKVCYAGLYGYTYDIEDDSKKKTLAKDVPTTTGYYVGDTKKTHTVVRPINIITNITGHKQTELEACLQSAITLLTHMAEDYFNIGIVTSCKPLYSFSTMSIDKLNELTVVQEDGTRKIGKLVVTQDEFELIGRFMDAVQMIKEKTTRTVWIDLEGATSGGLGNKRAAEKATMAELESIWGENTEDAFSITPSKEYENPESDFNKIVNASRWFFTTDSVESYYDECRGYRRYDFGKIDPEKKYYGKATPDVTYSALFAKQPIVMLDKLYEFTKSKIKNPNELMFSGNLRYVKSKDIARLIDSFPGVKKGKELVVPFKCGGDDEPTLTELIDPPVLTYRIRESMTHIGIVFTSFLDKDENNTFHQQKFLDITDQIYVKEANKKGDIKLKLNPLFTQNTDTIKVMGEHPNAVKPVPIILSVGYDLPERNGLNAVEDVDVKVWLNLDSVNDNCLLYRTIVETKDWVYVNTSAVANVRVLNKSELGIKKD